MNCLKSDLLQTQFIDKTNQVGQPKLALIRLKSSLLPLPTLNEQMVITEKVEKLMKVCDELELRIEKSKKYSEKLMESILKKSFKA
ncbi:restriction endonuclease subunit S [Romboutsia sp. 1001713B170207_170306_H8]|uniref:restriction endonuclease subunit S n=1 Tax=Romboutsia sp. 1001713B170207_170306_H8 TaxID=2787112 RepID=UPI00189A9340|nr:restriction endonuclease subunit S [Romboutsia sp. 1001713B170207_170306_H8]